MNSYPQLIKQLNHLVRTISQCNYIPVRDKEDIVQDAMLKIVEKYLDGVLVDDFNSIKGYSFMILRNCCLQHRYKYSNITYTDGLDTSLIDEVDTEYEQEYENLVNRLKSLIEIGEFTEQQQEIINLILTNHSHKEIKSKIGIEGVTYVGMISSIRNEIRRKFLGKKKQKRYGKQRQ